MEAYGLIIFGITGNLAQIKLIPVLYDMEEKGLLPEDITIVGVARKEKSPGEFKSYLHQVLTTENRHHNHKIDEQVFANLAQKISYLDGNLDDPNFYLRLKNFLDKQTEKGKNCQNRIFYLATYPNLYSDIFENLNKYELNKTDQGWVRVMIEKPIGNDLASAQSLNQLLRNYFKEEQIYRLDHYLGKETLQNILTFRFTNSLFDPLISKDYVDHIQITAAEDFGIGKRGEYYDTVGALKDVGQNHLLQMLAFATMDAPLEFNNAEITNQRTKILENLIPDPKSLVLGQYDTYTTEENTHPKSQINTFFAFKTLINNDRFKNVPIYIRGGKKLKQTVTEIAIIFKVPANRLLKELRSTEEPNILIYRIQPHEGIIINFLAKLPGHDLALDPTYMQFSYKQDPHFRGLPDPYEKLLMDALMGNQTFFNDAFEIEAQWQFIDKLSANKVSPTIYQSGSWGPEQAEKMIAKDGRHWLEPSLAYSKF